MKYINIDPVIHKTFFDPTNIEGRPIGQIIWKRILGILENNGIHDADCRGQVYDDTELWTLKFQVQEPPWKNN